MGSSLRQVRGTRNPRVETLVLRSLPCGLLIPRKDSPTKKNLQVLFKETYNKGLLIVISLRYCPELAGLFGRKP